MDSDNTRVKGNEMTQQPGKFFAIHCMLKVL